MDDLELLRRDPNSRRNFLERMGMIGLGVAAAGLISGCGGGSGGSNNNNGGDGGGGNGGNNPSAPGPIANVYPAAFGAGAVAVLNYSLAYETMEAALYTQALNVASGLPIGNALVPAAQANSTYTLKVNSNIDRPVLGFTFLKQLAYIEAGHSAFFKLAVQANGGTPVPPNPGGYAFPNGPGNNLRDILRTVLPVQETSNRAVLGASPDIANNLNLLQTAGTIYSTECRYSAGIRFSLDDEGETGPVFMDGDRQVVAQAPSAQTFEKFKAAQEVLAFAQQFMVTA